MHEIRMRGQTRSLLDSSAGRLTLKIGSDTRLSWDEPLSLDCLGLVFQCGFRSLG